MPATDRDDCNIGTAEVHRYAGRLQDSMNLLDNIFGPAEQNGWSIVISVERGGGCDRRQRRRSSGALNRALQIDDHHPGALFGLALESDRRGNDMEALGLYERAASCFSGPHRYLDQPWHHLRRTRTITIALKLATNAYWMSTQAILARVCI